MYAPVCVYAWVSIRQFAQIILLLVYKPKTVWVLSYLHGNEYETTVGMRKVWGCIAVWIFFLLAYHHGATHTHTHTVQCFHSYAHATNTFRAADRFPAARGINSNLDRLPWTKHYYGESSEKGNWIWQWDFEQKVSRSVFWVSYRE